MQYESYFVPSNSTDLSAIELNRTRRNAVTRSAARTAFSAIMIQWNSLTTDDDTTPKDRFCAGNNKFGRYRPSIPNTHSTLLST